MPKVKLNTPFKDIKKMVDLRPTCLHCKAPIDTRRNRSGFLHDACEKATDLAAKRETA